MRALTIGVFVCAILVMAGFVGPAHADSRVMVESRPIATNAATALGVYLENTDALRSLYIPLVIRAGENAAYPVAITGRFSPLGRLPLPGPLPNFPTIVGYDIEDGMCKSGFQGGFGTVEGSGDGVPYTLASPDDPDALSFHRSRIVGDNLPPGTDWPLIGGQPSIIIDLTAGGTIGSFEIDTTCTNPAGHLLLVSATTSLATPVVFEKGLISVIDCVCRFQGDLNHDGVRGNLDLALLIDLLFVGVQVPFQESGCPGEVSDLNCDGFPNSMDLAVMTDHLYAGGPVPCDPCTCASYPDNCQ